MARERLSAAEARRLAIAAQGLHAGAPRMDVVAAARRLGLVQIDSVNVLARAHLLALRPRVPGFDPAALHAAAYGGRRRRLFEYWGHEASYLPVEHHAWWRWRMADAAAGIGLYAKLARFARERSERVRAVLREVEARGPLAAGDLEGGRGRGSWWGWSEAKHALEWLFWTGAVTTATRRGNFERVYDLPERCLPRAALDAPTPPRAEAQRRLMERALAAHGLATEPDLRDYLRLRPDESRRAFDALVEGGEAVPVRVAGARGAAGARRGAGAGRGAGAVGKAGAAGRAAMVMHRAARVPRRADARALLCPFDPLVWTRPRAERLFGMRVKLEIYTPEPERVHGYYVLPFLLGDALVARVDLKADRAGDRLLVRAAYAEPDAPPGTPAELGEELRVMADWLGLSDVAVEPNGDRAGDLARALGDALARAG